MQGYVAIQFGKEARDAILASFPPIHGTVLAHHVTLAYRPRNVEWMKTWLPSKGQEVDVVVTGCAHDKRVQAAAVKVGLECWNKYPHVTISVAEGVPPETSNDMLALRLPKPCEPFTVRGTVRYINPQRRAKEAAKKAAKAAEPISLWQVPELRPDLCPVPLVPAKKAA